MKKSSFCFIIPFFCFLFWIGFGSKAFSQAPIAPELIQDDPIVAALDKLYKLDLFEKGYAKINYPKNPKYHFAIDSIPHYDDLIYEARLAKLDALSPFDLEYNPYVQGYINMYTMRRREQVSRMMALSQYYFPMFEEMLDKYNLPLELKYLAICESALNPMAKSRSAAMGLWQFMYPTGKMFGLKVTSYVDERCDPYKSTQAACEYFQYLYGLFGDWQMVLAAYNGGPGTVNKAIRRSGGKKTYWEIRPYLPTETQGYVPAFIAVNYIMNYTSEHNIQTAIPKKIFLEVDTIMVKHQLSFDQISSMLDISDDELQYLNPSYRKRVIPVVSGEPSYLTLPSHKIATFINNEANIYNFQKPDVLSIDVIASQEIKKVHVVKKGEGLAVIAKKYGCTVSDIKSWNGITSNTISVGKKLTIYVNGKKTVEKKTAPSAQTNTPPIVAKVNNTETSTDGFKLYTIKKGDSLYKIAGKNNTTVDEIKRLNNFGVNYNLLPGKVIKINVL
ncbi:MAG: transglycosylase SLT domain-containing protein [Bacteroidetes bacterium]|nr:transglycosylase SLT domain-containing protein [Bacteroidota bacterium]